MDFENVLKSVVNSPVLTSTKTYVKPTHLMRYPPSLTVFCLPHRQKLDHYKTFIITASRYLTKQLLNTNPELLLVSISLFGKAFILLVFILIIIILLFYVYVFASPLVFFFNKREFLFKAIKSSKTCQHKVHISYRTTFQTPLSNVALLRRLV